MSTEHGPHYEWRLEETATDDTSDIRDSFAFTSLNAAMEFALENPVTEGHTWEGVLVRSNDRGPSWAYLSDGGHLPRMFIDGMGCTTAIVPQRFHTEVFTYKQQEQASC